MNSIKFRTPVEVLDSFQHAFGMQKVSAVILGALVHDARLAHKLKEEIERRDSADDDEAVLGSHNQIPSMQAEIDVLKRQAVLAMTELRKVLASPVEYELVDAVRNVVQVAMTNAGTIESMQARIDELMLEYCPDEMSEEQKTRWASSQKVTSD